MLEGQAPGVKAWLETAGERYGVKLVLLPQADWNNDLTPWPAEPVFKKGKAFGGNAEAYLNQLENRTIPDIKKQLGIVPDERWLLGVSLAGLFAVWAAAANVGRESRCGLFTLISAQTQEVADILTGKGIPTTFAWTEGTSLGWSRH